MVPDGLCEREGELARVDALLAAARAGRGDTLLITGPAGIGKTVLLGAARERADQAGMRVLAGRGGELESGFSFGVARGCQWRWRFPGGQQRAGTVRIVWSASSRSPPTAWFP